MIHNHNHNHNRVCKHYNVEFCSGCGKVFCKDCGKEWGGGGQNPIQPFQPWQNPWPFNPIRPTYICKH